jgi:hypothetical protein
MKGKEKSNKQQKEAYRTSKYRIKSSPSEASATFKYSAHSVPKATNFFINGWQKKDA